MGLFGHNYKKNKKDDTIDDTDLYNLLDRYR